MVSPAVLRVPVDVSLSGECGGQYVDDDADLSTYQCCLCQMALVATVWASMDLR